MLKRIKAAFRTNEPQLSSVAIFTLLNVGVIATSREEFNLTEDWGVLIVAIMMWPTLAFLSNLVEPIPKD